MNHDRQENTGDQAQAAPTPLPQWAEPGPVHPGEPLLGPPQQAPAEQATPDADDTNAVGQTPPARPIPRWVEPVPGEREPDPGPP